MTSGQLLFWIIVVIILYFLFKIGLAILIVVIVLIVIYYLINLFSNSSKKQKYEPFQPVVQNTMPCDWYMRVDQYYREKNSPSSISERCVSSHLNQNYNLTNAINNCTIPGKINNFN